jgi:hypothetical protein
MEGVGSGVITGGYGYVVAAYTLSACVYGGYWLYLVRSWRAARHTRGAR